MRCVALLYRGKTSGQVHRTHRTFKYKSLSTITNVIFYCLVQRALLFMSAWLLHRTIKANSRKKNKKKSECFFRTGRMWTRKKKTKNATNDEFDADLTLVCRVIYLSRRRTKAMIIWFDIQCVNRRWSGERMKDTCTISTTIYLFTLNTEPKAKEHRNWMWRRQFRYAARTSSRHVDACFCSLLCKTVKRDAPNVLTATHTRRHHNATTPVDCEWCSTFGFLILIYIRRCCACHILPLQTTNYDCNIMHQIWT